MKSKTHNLEVEQVRDGTLAFSIPVGDVTHTTHLTVEEVCNLVSKLGGWLASQGNVHIQEDPEGLYQNGF